MLKRLYRRSWLLRQTPNLPSKRLPGAFNQGMCQARSLCASVEARWPLQVEVADAADDVTQTAYFCSIHHPASNRMLRQKRPTAPLGLNTPR